MKHAVDTYSVVVGMGAALAGRLIYDWITQGKLFVKKEECHQAQERCLVATTIKEKVIQIEKVISSIDQALEVNAADVTQIKIGLAEINVYIKLNGHTHELDSHPTLHAG